MVKKSEPGSSSTLSASAVSKQVSWPWPYYCNHRPRTLSFRIPDDIFKTINSAYILDTASASASAATSSSSSPSPSSSPPPAATAAADATPDVSLESVIRLARSDRLFFDPGATSCSILDEASSSRIALSETSLGRLNVNVKNEDNEEMVAPLPYNDSVFLSVDSRDPVLDFRKSMEEMVAAHSLKDWDRLEELLQWYLKVNDEANHSYIYSAFLDLLVSRALVSVNSGEANSSCSADSLPASGPPCRSNYSPSSPLSFDTSSSSASSGSSSSLSMRCVSGLETEDYDKEQCNITLSGSSLLLLSRINAISANIDHD